MRQEDLLVCRLGERDELYRYPTVTALAIRPDMADAVRGFSPHYCSDGMFFFYVFVSLVPDSGTLLHYFARTRFIVK